jgi:hypothetical protein
MINGKGMYLWLMDRVETPAEIAWLAKTAGLGHMLIKVADGCDDMPGQIGALVDALHQEGVQAIGWQYIYRGNIAEADVAVRKCSALGLDAFVVNAEKEFDRPGMGDEAYHYMAWLRSGLGDDFPIGLSSYRYPAVHVLFPWREFLEQCDFVMPQVYWISETDDAAPVRNLDLMLSQHKALYHNLGISRVIIPTGAAFSEHGWVATSTQVRKFLQHIELLAESESLILYACNFWEWWEARVNNPSLWPVIDLYPWRTKPMSQFDNWADAVTDALRADGHEIPDPPVTTIPEPEPFQVRFDNSVNLRDAPAGRDIGDVIGVVTIQPPTQRKALKGVWYEWGLVSSPEKWAGGWVALDNGVRL